MSKWRDAIEIPRNEDATGVWDRIDWTGLFEANIKALFTLIGGLIAYAVSSIPKTATRSLEAFGSFAEEVAEVATAVPTQIISGSFDAAIAEITTHGVAGAVFAIGLFALAFSVYGLGVRLIAS